MKVSPSTYVPALKWRQAEYQALLRLAESAKSRIIPFLIIPPVEYDFEDETPKKGVHEHVYPFPARLRAKWKSRPAWIDVDRTLHGAKMDTGQDVYTFVFSEVRKFKSETVPACMFDSSTDVLSAIAEIVSIDRRGLAVRVQLEHIMRADFSARLAAVTRRLGVTHDQVDFILDLGAPAYEPYEAFASALSSALAKLAFLGAFRSFVMIGTAFPSSMQDIKSPGSSIKRHDWKFYQTLVSKLPKGLRRPAFGDYTVVSPEFVANFDMRFVKPAGKLVYTTEDDWIVRKGSSFRDDRGQMHGHCEQVVRSGKFRGAGYSSADEYIALCAKKDKTAGPSNLTRWKTVGINHHITQVVDDLSTFAG